MGSTYLYSIRASTMLARDGQQYWALTEETAEANVVPITPRESMTVFGSIQHMIDRIFSLAGAAEDGCLRSPRGSLQSTTVLERGLHALAHPTLLPALPCTLSVGDKLHDIGTDSWRTLRPALLELRDAQPLVAALDAHQPVELATHTHASVLTALFHKGGFWRAFPQAFSARYQDVPDFAYKSARRGAYSGLAFAPRLVALPGGIGNGFLFQEHPDAPWTGPLRKECVIDAALRVGAKVQLALPGAYKALLAQARDSMLQPEPPPATVVIARHPQLHRWQQELYAELLGHAVAQDATGVTIPLNAHTASLMPWGAESWLSFPAPDTRPTQAALALAP